VEKCFIIQPFDKGIYDSRYKDTFEPAVIAAGLEPYRVDRDHSVRIPIEQIETGIKSSVICFAEITTNNPNIWYELGYAVASGKDVVLVCSEDERQVFPFDIQHRSIITYKSTTKSDFETLEKKVTEKILALLQIQNTVTQLIDNPIKESAGLKPHEVTALLLLMENLDESVSFSTLKGYMNKAGFKDIAASISIKELSKKRFVQYFKDTDYHGEEYTVCKITKEGEEWILDNQDKIDFRYTQAEKNISKFNLNPQTIDDLPF
jgi:hypothetical protein